MRISLRVAGKAASRSAKESWGSSAVGDVTMRLPQQTVLRVLEDVEASF
jgi:hypothetical protein